MKWRAVHEGQFMGVLRQPGFEFESDGDYSHWAVKLGEASRTVGKAVVKPVVKAGAVKTPVKKRSTKIAGSK